MSKLALVLLIFSGIVLLLNDLQNLFEGGSAEDVNFIFLGSAMHACVLVCLPNMCLICCPVRSLMGVLALLLFVAFNDRTQARWLCYCSGLLLSLH